MEQFIKHFRREGAGVWIFVGPSELQLPNGPLQVAPGTRFTLGTMLQLAAMLDAEYQRSRKPWPV